MQAVCNSWHHTLATDVYTNLSIYLYKVKHKMCEEKEALREGQDITNPV